jgi:hypothetical protein
MGKGESEEYDWKYSAEAPHFRSRHSEDPSSCQGTLGESQGWEKEVILESISQIIRYKT